MVAVDLVEIEQLLDVGEREAEPLAALDEGEPGAVAMRVDAVVADPLRPEEPLLLVEPDRARAEPELARELADRPEIVLLRRRVRNTSPPGEEVDAYVRRLPLDVKRAGAKPPRVRRGAPSC
jgi:hypothetical protein